MISEEDDEDESGESQEDTHGVKGTNKTTPSSYDGTAADSYLKQQANDNEVKHRKKRWFSGSGGGGGNNNNDRGHEDSPSAASPSSMSEKQRHNNSNSKPHESNLTAAFSAAKSDIKEKHEKHKAELKDLQSKATASKNNFLHGHSPRKGDHYRYHSNSDGRSSTHSLRSRASMDGTRSVNGGLRVGLRSSRSNLGGDGDTGSPARSLRDQELELERDVPDQWGPHTASSAASIQRVQSQWGLNDEAEMGLG